MLSDVISASIPDDPNERIDKGELILTFDSEQYKIGRGVNSLVTFTTEKGEEFSKIKIVEGIDLYQDDIRSTFEESYLSLIHISRWCARRPIRSAWRFRTRTPPKLAWTLSRAWCGRRWPGNGPSFTGRSANF